MENKKEEKNKLNSKVQNFIPLFLSISIFIYFLYGFNIDENSAGAGGYEGDFKLIWSNLALLKENLLFNIANPEYNDSRPPYLIFYTIFLILYRTLKKV